MQDPTTDYTPQTDGVEVTTTETPQTETPVAEMTPQELYEVKVRNQTIKVPLDELRNGYSRQQDYTQKTTELAEWRKQAEAEVRQYAEAIQQYEALLADPRVRNYLESLNAGNESLDDVPTVASVQKLLESRTADIDRTINERIAAAQMELEVKSLQTTYEGELSSAFKSVTEKFPFLMEIPDVEKQLRRAVANRGPQDINDAKRLLVEEATTRAQKVVEHFDRQRKTEAVSRASKLKGIEPPGGAPAPSLGGRFKLGSNELREQAIADLVAGFNESR